VKIVLDTNVLIAAFYKPPNRPCFSRDVYDYAVENATVYVSSYILREFREKCIKKLGFKAGFVRHLEALIKKNLRLETVRNFRSIAAEKALLRDLKDHPVADLAVSAGADLLLTWDKDLLTLKKIGAVQILTPRQCWQSLG
jgi:putative PIN family toxin of toxin-antitoxin system